MKNSLSRVPSDLLLRWFNNQPLETRRMLRKYVGPRAISSSLNTTRLLEFKAHEAP